MEVALCFTRPPIKVVVESSEYHDIERALQKDFPEYLRRYPDLSLQHLWLTYQVSTDIIAGGHAEILPHSVTFPIIDTRWCEVRLGFAVKVVLYKAGHTFAVSKDAIPVLTQTYFSNAETALFIKRLNIKLAMVLERSDVTVANSCYDGNGAPFVADHLMDPMVLCREYFLVQKQSTYFDATVLELQTKVAFSDQVTRLIRYRWAGKKRKLIEGTKSEYMSACSELQEEESPLQKAIKCKRTDLSGSTEWARRVDACVGNLLNVNRHVRPASLHSDGARKLVINEVVKQVAAYINIAFSVEEPQNSEEDCNGMFLGWGTLDYLVSDRVVIVVCGDENDNGSADTPSQEGSVDAQEDGKDASQLLDDANLALGGCQCHDLLLGRPEMDSAALILCTGHRWRHFLLQRGAHGSDAKPLLTYMGETTMRVLRSPVASKEARRGGANRSCCYWDELKVSRSGVENVMLALLCSTTHTSLEATVSTTTAQADTIGVAGAGGSF